MRLLLASYYSHVRVQKIKENGLDVDLYLDKKGPRHTGYATYSC